MDQDHRHLVEALRAGAGQEEVRLYRSGKLPGLFNSRTSANAEFAAQALRQNLIEIVRSETKGKTVVEWVRLTSEGMQFFVEQESPLKVLEELHALLRQNKEGLPAWLAAMNERLETANRTLVDEFQAMARRIDWLGQRVEALKRAERMGPALCAGAAGTLPWSNEAMAYLERRRDTGLGENCPLPELFSAVRKKEPDLTIRDFHSGLRRLHDRGVVRLLAHDDDKGPPEPEYALLDGATMYFYAAAVTTRS